VSDVTRGGLGAIRRRYWAGGVGLGADRREPHRASEMLADEVSLAPASSCRRPRRSPTSGSPPAARLHWVGLACPVRCVGGGWQATAGGHEDRRRRHCHPHLRAGSRHRSGPGSSSGHDRIGRGVASLPVPPSRREAAAVVSAVLRVVGEELVDSAARHAGLGRVAFEMSDERDQRLPPQGSAARARLGSYGRL
jgi:hypothetical protein